MEKLQFKMYIQELMRNKPNRGTKYL